MAYSRTLPAGVSSGLVVLRYTPEQKLKKAQESYQRACNDLALAEVELKGLKGKAEDQSDSDRYQIMIQTAESWVKACKKSKREAAYRLAALEGETNG